MRGIRGLGLGFSNHVGTWRVWKCVCVLVAAVWVVTGRIGGGLGPGWCYIYINLIDCRQT